jgi:hypothetical protein
MKIEKHSSVVASLFLGLVILLGATPLVAQTTQSNCASASFRGIWYATTYDGSWHYKFQNPNKWKNEVPQIVSSYASTTMLLSANTVIKNRNIRQFFLFPAAIKKDTTYVLSQQQNKPRKSITEIVVRFIQHDEQRYNTVGDWYFSKSANANSLKMDNSGSVLVLTISMYPTWQFSSYTGFHELAEALLCSAAGVTPQIVDTFDLNYTGDGEPGDDPSAPYHVQHTFASLIEEEMCDIVSGPNAFWGKYEEEYITLTDSYEEN